MSGALCPRFHKAIELIGGRWTGAILHLLLGGRTRFIELKHAIPDISDRMLSDRLRVLESEGLVVRTVIPEIPVRVEYSLSPKGRELQSSLQAVGKWAERWLAEDGEAPAAERRPSVEAKPTRSRARPATRVTR